MNAYIGIKLEQTQRFLEDGRRIPVTIIGVSDSPVVSHKTKEKDGYSAVQIGIGTKKKASKSILGHIRGAKLETAPRFLREIRVDDASEMPEVGSRVKIMESLKPGDIVDVIGISKGKGFAGVVKRHHFKGGPRTHGQSDRERAPGSIGQTTTPGRVYKGKRMAGRMGSDKVTIRNLEVIDVTEDRLFVKGLVPGSVNTLITITKVGEKKKFVGLFQEKTDEPEVQAEAVAEVKQEETPVVKVESVEEAQPVETQAVEVAPVELEETAKTEAKPEVKKEEENAR